MHFFPAQLEIRAARFLLMQFTKMGKDITKIPQISPNGHKIYHMAVKETVCPKTYQHPPLQEPPEFTQIAIIGLENIPSGNPA
jgi:hypothetical protein